MYFLIGTPFDTRAIARQLQLPEPAGGCLSPLPTRDPVIVHIAVLAAAKRHKMPLSQLPRLLPPCHKLSDRIPDYPNDISSQMLQQLANDTETTAASYTERTFGEIGTLTEVNTLDGVRMIFNGDEIIHLRASGNAPEFRCYVEAASRERSHELLGFSLAQMQKFRDQSR